MLRLQLFGRFRVEDGRGNEIPIKSRKAKALLAYLASPLGKPRSREAITALLWSDRGDEQARGSLRQALSGLRRDLGEDAMKALLITDDHVALDPSYVSVAPPSTGDELLEGLHINDPAFEEWLRDERLRLENETPHKAEQEPPPLPQKPSIAVLPFVNLSNDPEQDFFCDGVTEDIITALSKIPDLLVIAPNSIRIYKGQDVELAQVSREQGVRYILKGSVRRAGARVRVATQLTDATTGHQLWAERYNRELQDIFAVQDEITLEVVTALDVRFARGEQARSYWSGTKSLEAWGCIRRAAALIDSGASAELWEAKRLCNEALEHDPNYAMAWVQLGWIHHHEAEVGVVGTSKAGRQAVLEPVFECAKRALELEPSHPAACSLLSWCHLSSNQHEQAIAMSDKAVDMAPNHADILAVAAVVRTKSGQPELGLELIRKAIRLCPINSDYFPWVLGTAYRLTGQLEAAVEAFEEAIEQAPDVLFLQVGLASTLGELDRIEDAKKHACEIVRLDPDFSIEKYIERLSYKDREPITQIAEGLRKAGLPE